MRSTRQSRRDERQFQKFAMLIIQELMRKVSPAPDGSGEPDFAIANFSSVPELTYLAEDAKRQEQLRKLIAMDFGRTPRRVEFRHGTRGIGVIILVNFG